MKKWYESLYENYAETWGFWYIGTKLCTKPLEPMLLMYIRRVVLFLTSQQISYNLLNINDILV